ncbi:MAG TPA: hypothetical protein VFP05_08055, partial [Thermomicrobiales bacterium]|nr:hypothetical protein [Thermomicrobiales bacterium]
MIALLLLPILAACGFGSGDSNGGQISWTQGTRPPDGIAPPVSTEAAQPTVATTVMAEPTQPATTPLPTMPAATTDPTVAATTAATSTSAAGEPAKPAVTGQILSPEQLQEFQPNELGYVPVIMYHNIVQQYTGEEAGDVLFRTEEELRGDLQWLYDHDFY